jgi:hypothetical protein
MSFRLRMILAAALIAGATGAASGATVYVDDDWVGTTPGADPDGAGPATAFGTDAFATIQDAINGASPGDTISVAAGTYAGSININKDVTITGAGAASTLIQGPGTGATNYGFAVTGVRSNINVSGFRVTGFHTGFYIDPSVAGNSITGGSLTNCEFIDNGWDAVNLPIPTHSFGGGIFIGKSSGFTIANNLIEVTPGASGIAISLGIVLRVANSNMTIENNTVRNQVFNSIFISAGDQTPAGLFPAFPAVAGNTTGITLRGNTFDGAGTIALECVDGRTDNTFADFLVEGNTFANAPQVGAVFTVGGYVSSGDIGALNGLMDGLVVRGNTFRNSGFIAANGESRGGLYISVRAASPVSTIGHRGVLIEDNTFENVQNGSFQTNNGAIFLDRRVAGPVGTPDWVRGNRFLNCYNGINYIGPNALTISRNYFKGCTAAIRRYTGGGNYSISGNQFHSPVAGSAAIVATANPSAPVMVTGNEFYTDEVFLGTTPAVTNFNFSGNWYASEFDTDTDGDGLINGLVKTVSIGSSAATETDSSVVAQLDRDADGLSDAYELSGIPGTSFTNSDSNSDSVPDGATVPGFSLLADSDLDGFVDWYEKARLSDPFDPSSTPSLGDVLDNGTVDLGDAVRALQVINGSVSPTSAGTDANALNVTGTSTSSLNNPLQILRFQNGSRSYLPALPGIN